jgi:hypothetical protein
MTFEELLRDRLERDAASVALPPREPGRAVARARARRRHRRVAVGVAAVSALGLASIPLVAGRGDDASVTTPGSGGLPPTTGPLDLDWRDAPGGLTLPRSTLQTQDGSVYALSSGPGVHDIAEPAMSAYRLAGDGTWQPLALPGDRPRASTLAEAGGLLYAISTSPVAGGASPLPHVGVSPDGGRSWSDAPLPVTPAQVPVPGYRRVTTATLASKGTTTLALVNTTFEPDIGVYFPWTRTAPERYRLDQRDEGLVLTWLRDRYANGLPPNRPSPAEAAATGTPGPYATVPPGPQPTDAQDDDDTDDVAIVPWSELGQSGKPEVGVSHELFVRSGDGWQKRAADLSGLDDPDNFYDAQLSAVGDRFVIQGRNQRVMGSTTRFLASDDDGAHWSAVQSPDGAIFAAGTALVSAGDATLHVSTDAGGSWTDVDLAEVGAAPGTRIGPGSVGGPLGAALILEDDRNGPVQVAVSGDLSTWVVRPLTDIVGPGTYVSAWAFVGADRIVVGAEHSPGGRGSGSVTAVGIPVRR